MMTSLERLSEQVKAAVDADSRTREELCRLARIDPATLSRFMSGKRLMSFEALDRLGLVLGLRVSTLKKKEK